MDAKPLRPRIRQALWRGWRRRCPRCGRGPLFATWFRMETRCSVCRLLFERRAGDTWAFWLIGDRVFIAALLAVIVLGFRSTTTTHVVLLFLAAAVPLVWTMPNRLGVCVALDYLSRVHTGQLSEDSAPGKPAPDRPAPGKPDSSREPAPASRTKQA